MPPLVPVVCFEVVDAPSSSEASLAPADVPRSVLVPPLDCPLVLELELELVVELEELEDASSDSFCVDVVDVDGGVLVSCSVLLVDESLPSVVVVLSVLLGVPPLSLTASSL